MMTHGCSPFTFWLILNNELLVPAALKASSITLSFCFFKHFLGIVIYCSAWNSSSLSLNRQWWHSMHQFASRAWHLRCFHVTHRKSSPKTDMYYLYNLPTSFSYLWCFKDSWALRIDKTQPSFSSGDSILWVNFTEKNSLSRPGWYSFLHSSSVSIHFFSEKNLKIDSPQQFFDLII